MLASTQDSTIRLWNYQTSRCVKTYTGHTNATYSLVAAFSTTGGQYIVSGSEDARIYIWDLQSRRVVQTLEGHKGGRCTMYPVLNRLNWHRCHSSYRREPSLSVITLITAYIYGTDTSNTEINSIGIDGKRPDHSSMAMVRRMNGCGLGRRTRSSGGSTIGVCNCVASSVRDFLEEVLQS